jgi:hypothetical protein
MKDDEIRDSEPDLDRAVAARLARLRTMPVDASRLEKSLRARIPDARRKQRFLRFRSIQTIAASFVLLGGIVGAILLTASSGRALASPALMAQMHEDIVAGRVPIMQVDSITAANQMLANQSPGSPSLPQMPDSHVMACCMKSVHDKKVACVLLKDSGIPVTLSVANASDMELPSAPVTMRNGLSYRVQSVRKLSMVMTERNGKWLCLIGELPADRLMDMAAQVQF